MPMALVSRARPERAFVSDHLRDVSNEAKASAAK
jgi:hypothetical protein